MLTSMAMMKLAVSIVERRRERRHRHQLGEGPLREDERHHHDHQHEQRRRHDHVEELDRGRTLGDDEPGEQDRPAGGDDDLAAGGGRRGIAAAHQRLQAVDRVAEHQAEHRQPAEGQEDDGEHVDEARPVGAEHAAQEDELLDPVAPGGDAGGERGDDHADDVADDDGGDAFLRTDEEADGAADQEGPGGDREGGVGVGEFPEAPEPLGGQEGRVATLGGEAIVVVLAHVSVPRSRGRG